MPITAKVETITKEVACKYLEANFANRQSNQRHLNDLMARQRRGEWIPNGDAIRFDSEGHLRDGQHRLKMVLMTEIPIETVVVRGISPAAFITIDTGKGRNLTDIFSIKEYSNPSLLAGAVRHLRIYVSHIKSASHYSHEQQCALLEKHPGLLDSMDFYLGLDRPSGAPVYKSVVVTWHYLFSRVSPEASNDFIERFVTGLHLNEPNDPVYRLRGQVVANPTLRKPLSEFQIFGIGIYAWNNKQQGKEQKKAAVPLKKQQLLPLISGFPKELMEIRQLNLMEEPEETNENNSE